MFESDWFCLHFLQLQSHGPTLSSGFKMRGFRGLDFRGSGGGSLIMLAACRAWAITSTGIDVEATEAGTSEAGTSEAGTSKAGTSEAGTSEAGTSEAGPSEAGPSKTGPSEAGTSEAGFSEAGTSELTVS